jgi:hypothetical protein
MASQSGAMFFSTIKPKIFKEFAFPQKRKLDFYLTKQERYPILIGRRKKNADLSYRNSCNERRNSDY